MKNTTPKRKSPPAWAVRFFRWYCNDHLREAVLGDMEELYVRRVSRLGKRRADLLFVWNVLLFLQPFAIKERPHSFSENQWAMFENYFKIAWRTMGRKKMYTSITIGGFALGLATCLVIFLFIRSELSYDKHYQHGERIFRISNDYRGPENDRWTSLPPPFAQILKNDYPEVEKVGRLVLQKWFNAGSNLFRREDQLENIYEEGFAYADPDLLEILEIPIIKGNKKDALTKPNSLVISKRMAEKYFPNEDPIGKTVILNENKSQPLEVGGVMADFPSNSHLHVDFLITLTGVEFWPGEQTNWCCWNYDTYIRLRSGADPKLFENKLLAIRSYITEYLEKMGDQSASDVKKYCYFLLQPIQNIYLNPEGVTDELKHGDYRYVWLFGATAVFILLLACINFINLSTAKSANRAKEVGLRKVVGSIRGHLVKQFLTESVVYSFVSFVFGTLIVVLTMPFFNTLTGKQLFVPWDAWWFIPVLMTGALVIGVVAGAYPSFYLSAFKPVDVLKGVISKGSKSSRMRSAMVIFQFTTSIILIIGTFVIYRQTNYLLNTKVGYDKDQVVLIQGATTLGQQQESFKNELLQLTAVDKVTISDYLPIPGTSRDQHSFWKEGKTTVDKAIYPQIWRVDEAYLPTMGMKLSEGRNFDRRMASDTSAVIINRTMAKALGFAKPLGQRITNGTIYNVIGVVDDFHFESMRGEIKPLCFVLGSSGSIAAVKVKSSNMRDIIQSLNGVWNKFLPHQPFRYSFLDERYARMYEDVERTAKIIACFAGLAVVVACLGLFALSSFMIEQRSKEISIRLVMGAPAESIFRLLTQNFVKLVLISLIIAAPLSWYLMQQWLEGYAYKINITWDVFFVAGMISIFIAVFTVSYQSVKAALTKPIDSLRTE